MKTVETIDTEYGTFIIHKDKVEEFKKEMMFLELKKSGKTIAMGKNIKKEKAVDVLTGLIEMI